MSEHEYPLPNFSESMFQVQQECLCGKKYWPTQAWQHNGCLATNYADSDATNTVVANETVANRVVANRYKDKEARKKYMREYMRKKRLK